MSLLAMVAVLAAPIIAAAWRLRCRPAAAACRMSAAAAGTACAAGAGRAVGGSRAAERPAVVRCGAEPARAATRAITEILRNISTATEGELDDALTQALVAVGGLATVDRCFLVRLGPDGETLSYEFQWCAEGIAPVPARDQITSLRDFPWLREQISIGHPLHVEDIAALPLAAAAEKAVWLRNGARSHLTVPMFDEGIIAGLLSFHSVNSVGHWDDDDVRLLEIFGQILVGAWQRRRTHRSLAATNRLLADIIDFLPDPTFVVDNAGRVVAWNQAIEELTGVTKEAMLGRGDYAYALPFHGRAQPLLIDHIRGRVDLAALDGHTAVERHHDNLCAEWNVPGLNGVGERCLWLTASPLRDHEGHIIGAIESLRDITDRKRTELALRRSEERVRLANRDLEQRVAVATTELRGANAALREKEERYRRIIESLGDRHVFFSHDLEGRLLYVSPSYRRLLGTENMAELTVVLRAWLQRARNRRGLLRTLRMLRGERQPAWDLVIGRGDGAERILEVQGVPVRAENGEVVAVEGVARDVTEERRNSRLVLTTRERLLETEKLAAIGSMVAGLTHEMATPLGVGVTAATHLVRTCREGLDAYREGRLTRTGFERIFGALDEAAGAVDANLARAADLLRNFKQVAGDQSAGEARDVDLAEYLAEIVYSLQPRFRNTGFAIDVACPPDIRLHCDPGAVYRVVSNLVMNSLTHGFEGLLTGRISISVARCGDEVEILYRDDGVGMGPEQLARIYEPFYTTRRGRGGTGLGMHIVYGNVTHALNGSITCRSRPGGGTTFRILVPLIAEAHNVQATV